MRRVRRARREVHEERLVGHQGLLLTHPADRVVRQILRQVITLLGRRRRLDRGRTAVQGGIPLVVLTTDEAIEVLEAAATRRPGVERAHRRRLPHRHLVALTELCRRVTVQLQRHRQRRLGVRTQGAVARRRRRRLSDAAHPDRVMIPAGQHRLPRRRTQRRRVEPVEPQAAGGQTLRNGRAARTTEGARCPEPDIIDQDHQHVRRPCGGQQGLDRRKRRVGVLCVIRRQASRRTIRNRQHRAGMPVRTHHIPPSKSV